MNLSKVFVILSSLFEVLLGKPKTTKSSTAKPILFRFEGVDYDELPPNLYDENNDCYSHFLKCIRHTTIINPVCGWNAASWYFDDFYSPCEIELLNCKHRVEKGFGIFGIDQKNDIFYYNGEGYECKYYVRMGGNMMDAYFGNSSRRFNFNFEKIRRLPYKVLPSKSLTSLRRRLFA